MLLLDTSEALLAQACILTKHVLSVLFAMLQRLLYDDTLKRLLDPTDCKAATPGGIRLCTRLLGLQIAPACEMLDNFLEASPK